ncbi:WD domain, G-beta repeat [Novymonas esmeraldas]|uniref:WD domain, G-beta repeat n=1 Tax=Novymonas esmeraldas TaxID=1808958 RepID=A0AAW0F4J9_9TRYP
MGNTCTKTGEVADNRKDGRQYRDESPQQNKPSPSQRTTAGEQAAATSPSAAPSPRVGGEAPAGAEATAVVKNIEALQHTLKPTVSVVTAALRHDEFRQFTSIFARGKATLAVASCAPAQRPRHILAAGEDRSMVLLNYETGHVMRRWVHAHKNDINCITTPTPTGLFATASRDKTVKLWDFTSDGSVAELLGHTLNVTSIDMSANADLLVSGSKDNTVRLWDVSRAEELFCGDVKLNIVHFVRFMPSMNCVAQGGEDLAVRLWDVRTRGSHSELHLGKTVEGMDYYPVCCDTVPGNSHTLLTGHNGVNGCGSYVAQWDVRTGKRVALFKGHNATVSAVRMVAPGVYGQGSFFTSSDDGTFGVWNLEDGEEAGEVQLPVEHHFRLPEGRVTSFEAEENGDTVIALDDGCIVILRPSKSGDSVVPSKRLRYIGVLTAR